jgi:hypothetical protein
VALDATNVGVNITGVANLTVVSGKLAVATLAPANVSDTRSWFALKMGNVVVTGGLDPALNIGLTAQLTVKRLDYNSATGAGAERLNWASTFDLNGDGTFDDVLDPGADLPAPAALPIDFASSLQLRVSGTLTGTGQVGNAGAIGNDPIDNAFLTAGPLQVTGTAGFALTRQTVNAKVGDANPIGATLTGLALDATNVGVNITGVAQLSVSGKLAVAALAPTSVSDARSWFALTMGDVTVAGGLDPALNIGLSAQLTISRLEYNSATGANAQRLNWARAFDQIGRASCRERVSTLV